LVVLEGDPLAPRKGLLCKLSRKGRRLYDKAITEVRRRQAAMILELDPHEREVTYIALKKLYSACSNTKE
jgi:DNA-binding MarR family transcriptional regulator